MIRYGPGKHAGMTLIEMVVVIVILAIALVGVTGAISSAMSRSANILIETRAPALAQSYLDEIVSRRFDEASAPRGIPPCRGLVLGPRPCTGEGDFGPDGGETRAEFDDVDDYHGLDEGYGRSQPLQDSEGSERQGYDNFRVRVSVRYLMSGAGEVEEALAVAGELVNDWDAKLITVTVSHVSQPDGWQFSVYKANF